MPYVDVTDTTLYYEDEGSGRPLLFLHGWGTSGRAWDAQMIDFVADHRVVVPDWRGCGRSARPAAGNTVDGVVGDLVALIDALGLDRPVVVGSSVGAVFGTELALRRPELVGGVVAVDGPAYWPSQGMDLPAMMRRIAEDRAGFLAGWVPNWYAAGAAPALVDRTVRELLDASPFVVGHFVECATYDPRPALPALTVPIHYVHGELDAEIPLAVPRTCAALTPGATVTLIDGAGHMPQQERPTAFNAALRSVLANLPIAVG